MKYPGNPSLAPDIRERILSTFRQTLDLASQGNRQEASLGCDFILRLDPEFDPARVLMGRIETGQGPVGVEDLAPGSEAFAAGGSRDQEVEDLFGDRAAEGDGGSAAGADTGLRAELGRLFEERRFAELSERARKSSAAVMADPELARMAEAAQARQEAEPYVLSFLDSARQELRAGEIEKATALLTKARQLDAGHPGLADLEQILRGSRAAGAPAPPGAAAPPSMDEPILGEELSDEPFEPFTGDSSDLFSPEAADAAAGADLDFSWEPPNPEGPGAELDFGTASGISAVGADEGDARIRDLLQEGQAAFERSDYQGAIDAWSRIFLIDIDHQEAARRIEEARRLKAEDERQIEEIFHEAVEVLEQGDSQKALEGFRKVLERQPNHHAAREYLQQLESGEISAAAASPPAPAAPAEAPAFSAGEVALQQEILVPPEPGAPRVAGAPAERRRGGSRRAGLRKSFLVIGGAVLVLLLAGVWFVWQRWERIFPNAVDEVSQPAPGGEDPIARATTLHDQGRVDFALRLLRRLSPDDSRYDEARALITQWEAEGQPAAAERAQRETAEAGAPAEEEPDGRARQIAAARAAVGRREYLRAEKGLQEAAATEALSPDEQLLLDEVAERLKPLRRYIEMVEGGNFEPALPDLWRLLEATPEDRDVRTLLVNSYYNLGVQDLQRGDAAAAAEKFAEASRLDSSDAELERHRLFAETYANSSKDLLYQIYVKYIPSR